MRDFEIVGPCNVQLIRNDDGMFFTEVNDRFSAGGLPLTVAAGANTPLMLLKMALGMPVEPVASYHIDLVMARYLTEMFMDIESIGQYVPTESVRVENL